MLISDWKDRQRAIGFDGLPADVGLYAQIRPSSGLRYPRLELDRWYPIRRQDDLGCFIEIGNAEMYLERGHYVCREGRRGSDRARPAAVANPGMAATEAAMAVEGLARGA